MQAEVRITLMAFFILYTIFMIVTVSRILQAVDKNIKTQVKYFNNKKVSKNEKKRNKR